MKTKSGPQQ